MVVCSVSLLQPLLVLAACLEIPRRQTQRQDYLDQIIHKVLQVFLVKSRELRQLGDCLEIMVLHSQDPVKLLEPCQPTHMELT